MEPIIHFPAGKFKYPQEPDGKRMCGDGRLETLAQAPKSPHLRAKFGKFENGDYTKWHCHQGGEQVLYVTEGNGFVQEDGQPKIRLQVGDRVYSPEGIWHRHGALEEEKGKFFPYLCKIYSISCLIGGLYLGGYSRGPAVLAAPYRI